jgi:predicted RNA polymerase sigma factor
MHVNDSPAVALNHAAATAMANGPAAGLELLSRLETDQRLVAGHRLLTARAHMLEMAGELAAARACYLQAAERTASLPQQRYLNARAARLADAS